jgi:SAM-dependent methyltransferase
MRTDTRLECPVCSGEFRISPDEVRCGKCGRRWPVDDEIVVLSGAQRYWGEVSEADALQFLRDAEAHGWEQAARSRFADEPDMLAYLLDWQRASWVSMLALPPGFSALDVGAGYGAITHALARVAGEVCCVEAVPARIQFVRTRLRQSNIANVQLIQGSALSMPFKEESFDLIVVNGVLEWIGEWSTTRNPRAAQVSFLSVLRRSLKRDGVLLVGIENRFGYDEIRGAVDHSGVAYTSLMPRRVASWYLRLRRRSQYRTATSPDAGYRTYTYSLRGYNRLLRDSGLRLAEAYWAEPGYNQPYNLTPIDRRMVREKFLSRRSEPSQAPRRRGGLLKRLAAASGALGFVAPEFVLVAGRENAAPRDPSRHFVNVVRAACPEVPDVLRPAMTLSTYAWAAKSVVTVLDRQTARPAWVVKTSNGGQALSEQVCREFEALQRVNRAVKAVPDAPLTVPIPMGRLTLNGRVCSVEQAIPGMSAARLVFRSARRQWTPTLERHLPTYVRCADAVSRILLKTDGPRTSADLLPRISRVGAEGPEMSALLAAAMSSRTISEGRGCVQHGDFTLENLVHTGGSFDTPVAVIDWEHCACGFPPLYDVFSLLVSALPAHPEFDGQSEVGWVEAFDDAFFGHSAWTALFSNCLASALTLASVRREDLWALFSAFLLARYDHFRHKRMSAVHGEFIRRAAASEASFLDAH